MQPQQLHPHPPRMPIASPPSASLTTNAATKLHQQTAASSSAQLNIPSSSSSSSSTKSLLLDWDTVTVIDARQYNALQQLQAKLDTRRNAEKQSQGQEKFQPTTNVSEEEKKSIDDITHASEEESILGMHTRQHRHAAMAAYRRSQQSRQSQLAVIKSDSSFDNSNSFPFVSASPSIPTSLSFSSNHHASIYSLLMQTQFYTRTPEYIMHLSRLEAEADTNFSQEGMWSESSSAANTAAVVALTAERRRHLQYYLQLRTSSAILQRLLASTQSLLTSSNDLLRHCPIVFNQSKLNSVREEASALLIEQPTKSFNSSSQQQPDAPFEFQADPGYFVEYEKIAAQVKSIWHLVLMYANKADKEIDYLLSSLVRSLRSEDGTGPH